MLRTSNAFSNLQVVTRARPNRILCLRRYTHQNAQPERVAPTNTMPDGFQPRTQVRRDLPRLNKNYPAIVGAGVLLVSVWAGFTLYSMNQERLASSVVRQVVTKLRDGSDPRLVEALGERIAPEPAWYSLGDPWINGAINLLQGHVDVSFRIRGTKGAGTVYFTSIRKAKGLHFSILRFKVICDDGTLIEDIHNAGVNSA